MSGDGAFIKEVCPWITLGILILAQEQVHALQHDLRGLL